MVIKREGVCTEPGAAACQERALHKDPDNGGPGVSVLRRFILEKFSNRGLADTKPARISATLEACYHCPVAGCKRKATITE